MGAAPGGQAPGDLGVIDEPASASREPHGGAIRRRQAGSGQEAHEQAAPPSTGPHNRLPGVHRRNGLPRESTAPPRDSWEPHRKLSGGLYAKFPETPSNEVSRKIT